MKTGPVSRRSALVAGGLAVAGSIAGCSKLGTDESRPVRLTHPKITNRLARRFDVDLHLLDAGETVYWRTVAVDARETGGNEQYGGAVLDGFPDEPGEYVLHARLVSVEADEPARSDLANVAARFDQSCLRLAVDIDVSGPKGGEHPSVSIAYSRDC